MAGCSKGAGRQKRRAKGPKRLLLMMRLRRGHVSWRMLLLLLLFKERDGGGVASGAAGIVLVLQSWRRWALGRWGRTSIWWRNRPW